jgi:hypothetical protein
MTEAREVQADKQAYAQAIVQIKRLMQECREGVSDREAEALQLAELWGFDIEPITESFKEARRAKQPAAPKVVVHRRRLVIDAKAVEMPEPKATDREAMDAAIASEPERVVEEPKVLGALAKAEPVAVEQAVRQGPIPGSWGRANLPVGWENTIEAMNEQHAIIDNVGGRTMISCWEPSSRDPNLRVAVFHTVASFKLRHSNRFVTIEVPGRKLGSKDQRSVPLGEYWLGHRDRAQYRLSMNA